MIYFDSFRQEEHDVAQAMSVDFLVQKLFAKKAFLPKNAILTLFDLCTGTDPENFQGRGYSESEASFMERPCIYHIFFTGILRTLC